MQWKQMFSHSFLNTPSHKQEKLLIKFLNANESTQIFAITSASLPKGDVIATARIAGIQAAKKTSDLIPLCHPLMLSAVTVNISVGEGFVAIEAIVETTGQTGVEMEALTACSVAALTIYDMCKSADKSMVIGELALWEKSGGRSGTFQRHE